jgi:DNA-directed RNA polymerase subunit M/transcription elongation factor TFIIS
MTGHMSKAVCPRCRGYMYTNQDQYGRYRECLHCGHMVDIERQNERKSVPGRGAA